MRESQGALSAALAAPVTVLLVGSGGREHALAAALVASPWCARLIVAPGNPGIAGLPRTSLAAVSSDDRDGLLALAAREGVGFVVCGPEAPLVAGLGDAFATHGVPFFGPRAAAAEIEGSKAYAKRLMQAAGVPTAAYGSFADADEACAFIDAQPHAVVVKADGLCAGKGVVVADSHDEAKAAARAMLAEGRFGAAGARVVIEERLQGREVSVMALCDGERFCLLPAAEDHKTIFEGDRGPNTGGMGAYAPSPLVSPELAQVIAQSIFAPTVRALGAAGRPFRGLLYGGLILTARGPMVIEWNARFGDPETEAVVPLLDEDLLPWLWGAAVGALPAGEPRVRSGASVCVVLAAAGYPGTVQRGDVIEGLPEPGEQALGGNADVQVFHAGTALAPNGRDVVTAGGRVLAVSGTGTDLADARRRVYGAAAGIRWPGRQLRRDIGLRGQVDLSAASIAR